MKGTNERLTDEQIERMIALFESKKNEISGDPVWIGEVWSQCYHMAMTGLREVQLLRAQCDDQAALITRLEHRLLAKGLDHD